MRHVAYLIPTLDRIGGAERQVVLVAKGLAARGWRISVIALSGFGGSAAAELGSHGIEFISLAMRKGLADPRGWLRLRSWIRRKRPDILHGHLPHAAWMGRWIRLMADVPVVLDTIHTSAIGPTGRIWGFRLSRWLPDHVTAVSQDVASAYEQAGMISPARLRVIPNGVEASKIIPDSEARNCARARVGVTDEFLWLAVGRLEAVKDYPTLLAAFASLRTSAHLVIAGTGSCESVLVQLSDELGVQPRVHFLGFTDDVQRWFQAADGFVISSLWEGLPVALLEAASWGLPAVGTDVAGTRRVIQHGTSGLLVQRNSPCDLAKAMSHMMEMNREDRLTMGLRAKGLTQERFSMECVLTQWEKLYAELLYQTANAKRKSDCFD